MEGDAMKDTEIAARLGVTLNTMRSWHLHSVGEYTDEKGRTRYMHSLADAEEFYASRKRKAGRRPVAIYAGR